MFCFVLDMIPMLPREFARLKQAGGLGGAQPPPFANTMLALRPFKLLPKSSTEGPAGIKPLRRLKLLPEPITPFIGGGAAPPHLHSSDVARG